jgi:hypothetical protein
MHGTVITFICVCGEMSIVPGLFFLSLSFPLPQIFEAVQ